MLFKTTIVQHVKLSFNSKTVITFDENHEFSLTPQNSGNNNYIFQAHDFKGNLEIIKINCAVGADIPYDKETKTFVTVGNYSPYEYYFSILTDIEYKKVAYQYVQYTFNFPLNRIRLLQLYEYYEEFFTLPEYNQLKFKYYIKKIKEDAVEVCIENPYNVDIYDVNKSVTAKVDEFKHQVPLSQNINLNLAFVFDPFDYHRGTNFLKNSNTTQDYNPSEFYEIMSNPNYADVILFSSSGKEIPTYRCVLAKYSSFFEKCFEESKEFPVRFNIKEFDTETIKSALEFCYGKRNSIEGNEAKLFDFARKYSFTELMKACSNSFEKTVSEKNVCEIIQIAYSTGNESLKQKCHKIFAEHKGKIDPAEVKKLPHDILVNVFFV